MKRTLHLFFLVTVFSLVGITAFSQKKVAPTPPLSVDKEGKLLYVNDSLGNRIPDFSYCGYMAGENVIPDVSVKIVLAPIDGDATRDIQNALDYVATLPLDKNGFRGAVFLNPGDFKVYGSLKISASGIVLRGSGMGDHGTRLIASGKDRRTLISIRGINNKIIKQAIPVSDHYVPVNAFSINIQGGNLLKAGDLVLIHRPSTKEWIEEIGTDHFGGGITALGWKPEEHNLYWDRTITQVNGNTITLDAPITTALDKTFGGGNIIPYTWEGRIYNVGVENLNCISEYDLNNEKDESHSWMAITMESVADAWVRHMTFEHFAGSAVYIQETAKRITIENCKSLHPVSEIGGQRRYTFFTMGQQCLFQRLYAEYGYHDFALGFCAAGPNAFVQCFSHLPYSFSGPVDSWASGVLFDIVDVDGHALSYMDRGQDAQGAGWNAANSVFWQCSAARIDCYSPPTAQNWSFGSWAEFQGNGYWGESNNHVKPRSLYYAQLKERLGDQYIDRAFLLPMGTEASSSPSIEQAAAYTKEAVEPLLTVYDWIDQVVEKNPVPIDATGVKNPDKKKLQKQESPVIKANPLALKDGKLVSGNTLKTGMKQDISWWNGTVQPAFLAKGAKPHITRFVPGRTGTGLTDDVEEVATWMKENNVLALDHHYGLWYDRRRDDHERIRRMDGEVWPPFYEQPFARSGQGTAWDGLSKYDLTKFNDWYWMRLKQFADQADEKSLILLNQNYFQHNIIEAGAHWADSPWRPANNINNTGFPDPVPYAGDKRIFFAEQFYDVNHPVRRELHRKFIRQNLENFRDNHGVIQLISDEFTGPLYFVEFWLDVIAEWEKETGLKPVIALSTTKDVQDAILSDPVRSKVVDVIDIRYWFYRHDGTTYEPKGGQNLAPRQHARLTKPGKTSFESVFRAVNEYRSKYPEKAVMYFSDNYPQYAWASFIAGGSLACLPEIEDGKFLEQASVMAVMPEFNNATQYVIGAKDTGFIVYTEEDEIHLDLNDISGKFTIQWINPKDGKMIKGKTEIKGNTNIHVKTPQKAVVAWISKK